MLNNLYQYIVPLAFIAIWALTSLFNRESQPLPPRTARPPVPNGLRPAPSPATPRGTDWRGEANARGTVSPRQSASGSLAPLSRPGSRQEDDILIIEAEPRRPGSPTAGRATAAPSRRATRSRPSGQSTPRKPDAPTHRGLTLTHPDSPPDIHAQALKPLVLPPSPLLTTPNDEAAKTQAGRALVSQLDSFSSEEIRLLVQKPARLREGFIIAELLKPPLALRGGPFVPRHRPSGS